MKTYPITQTQLGIFLSETSAQGNANYNIDMLYHLDADIDIDNLKTALETVINNHPYVKSRIVQTDEGELFMEDHSDEPPIVEIREVASMDAVLNEVGRKFDLLNEPLYRLTIYIEKEGERLLYVDFHHIVFDGMSFATFRKELSQAYAGEALTPEGKDGFTVALEEEEMRKTETYAEAKAWHEHEFGAASEVESIPRPDVYDVEEGKWVFAFHKLKTTEKDIKAFCEKHSVSVSIPFTAAFGYTLANFSADEEALYTTVFHGRADKATRNAFTMMVKTLAVYHDFRKTPTVSELLQQTSSQMSGTRKRTVYSFAELHRDLGIEPRVCFAYQGTLHTLNIALNGKEQAGDDLRLHRPGLDFTVHVIQKGDGFECKVEYSTAMYSAAFVEQFCKSYSKVLDEMMTKEVLADIELVDEEHIAQLDSFNDNDTLCNEDDKNNDNIVSLFRKTAAQYPDNIAVIFKDKKISYRELDEATDRIASNINAEVVSILIGRSENMPICALSALKSGAAYQPLDPSYPQERLNFMVKDSNAQLLIADRELRPLLNEYEGAVIYTDELDDLINQEQKTKNQKLKTTSPFILLYTSGSTGVPKGVILEHGNLVTFCGFYRDYYDLKPEHSVAAYASFGFDANMMDTYPALLTGATMVIIPEEIRLDLDAIGEYLEKNNVTHAFFTTQVGQQFVSAFPEHKTLMHVSMGGEKMASIDPPVSYKMHNLYGPTECTVFATVTEVTHKEPNIPIGPSNSTAPCYIINKHGKRVPVGAAGELIITGPQVGRGYLNRPDKTAEVFNAIDFGEGVRTYRTGDIVRYRENGDIEFVGRKDGQVKIRGFRIELKEVETVIREFQGIKDATVQAFDLESGGKYIAAYIVSDEQIDIQALNDFILAQKPPYMVPAVTMQIEAIPLNVNQKVDKKKLPKPETASVSDASPSDSEAPRELNILEQQLTEFVGKLISNTPGVATPLSYCGLSSILSMRLAAQLFKKYGIKITSKELLNGATILTIENAILEKMLGADTVPEASPSGKKATVPETSVSVSAPSQQSPLTFPQQGVYFDCVKNPDTTTYNIPWVFTFSNNVSADAIADAIKKVCAAHPILRSRFEMTGEEVMQIIDDTEIPVDMLTMSEAEAEDFKANFLQPFDLSKSPLCRFAIVTTPTNVILFSDFHHLAFDGTSMTIFMQQLGDALKGNTIEAELFTYTQYAQEQAEFAKSEAFNDNKKYYETMLCEFEHSSEIPADLQGNETEGKLRKVCSPLAFDKVAEYAKANNITAAGVMLAATFYTVARFTNSDNVYLATISSGRSDVRLSDTVGMFINTLPLGIKMDKQNCAEFISQSAALMTGVIDHEAYPFARIAADYSFTPDIMFAYQMGVVAEADMPELLSDGTLANDYAKFKVEVSILEEDGVPSVEVKYNDALYSKALMQTLAESVATAAQNLIADSTEAVRKTSIMSASQAEALTDIRQTCMDPSAVRFPLFHNSIEYWAEQTPDKTAIIACNETLTYREFNEKANILAHALINKGVVPGDRVCLLLPRKSWHLIAMFGVMKAGAAYIPCDPEYPAERINLITEDSHARYVITTADKMEPYGNRALNIEDLLATVPDASPSGISNPNIAQDSNSLAYLIYTSGSTGRPKGVMLRHIGICNYLTDHEENRHFHALVNDCKTMLCITTVSFDLSLKEIGASLFNGMTLVFANEDQVNDPQALADLMLATGVDGFSGTPSRLKMFLDLPDFQKAFSQCKFIVLGGEKYPPTLLPQVKELAPEARLFNTYGPTEISVSSNGKELTHANQITIGRPLLNVKEYVVDNDLNELPIGVTGELLIGGLGVSAGYNDLPEKTAEVFIDYNGERCYKSGDYAYWNAEGDVIILGRKDHQIKLNGLRIELGEVETVLNKQPQVKEGVVMIKNVEGHDHLVAYYVANDNANVPDASPSGTHATVPEDLSSVLKEQMGKSLTHYMVPTIFMKLDKMPISPNGKTDLKALPQPSMAEREYIEPANDVERFFADTFAKILDRERVGATDNFFEIGGTSLVAIRVVMAAMQAGYKIVYKQVFDNPTPRALAELQGATSESSTTSTPSISDGVPTPSPASIPVTDDPEVQNYDYTAINELLNKNNLSSLHTEAPRALGTCIVTGATGFLGIHVVKELIDNPDVPAIYCMVRAGKTISAESRLRTQLFYYFGNTYSELFGKRIFVIDGDVTKPESLAAVPDVSPSGNMTLFNCAANVKHFSAGTDIEDINIGGCQTCIDFCLKTGARFIQTSTHSIAGTKESDRPCEPDNISESRLYWGQKLGNQYAHAKFIAERNVLEAVATKGLDGKIVRLGNLSARSTDGEFQINFTTNSFMGRLKAFQTIGCMPYQMAQLSIEFSPINEVAKAVVLLATTPKDCTVFHPVNAHRQLFDNIIVCLNKLGIGIKLAENDEYQQALNEAFMDPAKATILQSLMAYQPVPGKFVVNNGDNYEYTTQALLRLGFRWHFTSWDYMEQFISAIQGLGFFDDDYQR